jgi:hypothetical protein
MQTHLAEFVKRGWDAGASVDLTGVGYGREHWGSQTAVLVTPLNYYRFLAGISRLIGAQRTYYTPLSWSIGGSGTTSKETCASGHFEWIFLPLM